MVSLSKKSKIAGVAKKDVRLFRCSALRIAPIFSHFLRSHDVEAPVGGFKVSSQHSKCDIRDIP